MKVITIFVAILATISATTLKCQFSKNTIFKYICEIGNVELKKGGEGYTIDHSAHQINKTNDDVMMISFAKSTVQVVPNQIFAVFPKLEILDLIDVKMTKWNRDFVKKAKSLKRIWLAKNDLEELGDNSFLGATSLEILTLHNNKITKISDKAFNGLLQLKSLELQSNLLTTLSATVFAPLKKLKEINLSENQVAKIDVNAFSANIKLEFFNMHDNNITYLPENIFKNNANLTVVYLQQNQIEKIVKGTFSGCGALMELRLDQNLIKEIPIGLFTENKKFKLLNIMNNPIEQFDGKALPEEMELLYLGELVSNLFLNFLCLIG